MNVRRLLIPLSVRHVIRSCSDLFFRFDEQHSRVPYFRLSLWIEMTLNGFNDNGRTKMHNSRLASALATCILVLLCIVDSSHGLRILGLFPHPGASHFHIFHPVMRGLAEAGHDVTVVSHFPDEHAPPNYKDLQLTGFGMLTVDLAKFDGRPSYIHFLDFFLLHRWGIDACENALNSTHLRTILDTKPKYDVIVMEQFNSECMLGVAWQLQAPIVGMSSCTLMPWHFDRVQSPINPSFMPAYFMGYSDEMTFTERLNNWVSMFGMKLLHKMFMVAESDAVTRKYLKDDNMPYLGDLTYETSLMLVNTHYSLSGPKPFSPAVVEIGGVHIKEPKPLDADLQKLLDSATDGVIYVSWGSIIRAETLPEDKRNMLLKAFGSFKEKILWKWENTTLPNQPSNVFIRKWMPQREILCHPNVRVFWGHGGLLGTSEGAYCGVPMVLTPMYGDQFVNAAAARNRRFGNIVKYEDISVETVSHAIKAALCPEQQKIAKKVSYSYRHRPQTPLETAIWHIEHVAATGGFPLAKSNSRYLTIYAYYNFDVYATILSVLLISIGSWIFILMKCFNREPSSSTAKAKAS